tara:strand:- start:2323 stop:2691 length:369 start_codon:yes stop_codon:yes gene_type:complete
MNTIDELNRCKDWIEDALGYANGTHTYDDIVKCVIEGTMQLWAGETGCAITEVIRFPRKKVIHVFLAGGEMDQIIDFEESAMEFGRMNECTTMTIAGRKGWTKVLNKHGWADSFAVMSKEIC